MGIRFFEVYSVLDHFEIEVDSDEDEENKNSLIGKS